MVKIDINETRVAFILKVEGEYLSIKKTYHKTRQQAELASIQLYATRFNADTVGTMIQASQAGQSIAQELDRLSTLTEMRQWADETDEVSVLGI